MNATQDTAAQSSQPSSVYAWYVVLVLMLAQTFSFIDRMIMGLLVGPIRASFNISDTQYSLLAGLAFATFYAIMGLPLARIADSRSRRGLIAVGISFWSIMTTLCGFAGSFWTLFLARVGVGVGEASLSPAAYSLITDYFPKKALARALSVYTIGVTVGSGLAYMIGGKVVAFALEIGEVILPVVGTTEGWQLTFFLVGLPGIVVALLMLTVKEPLRKGRMVLAEDTAAPTPAAGVPLRDVAAFFMARRKAFLTHIIGLTLFIMVVFSLNIWGPEYLIRTFSMERADAGMSFGILMIVAGTAGLLTGGALADRLYSNGILDGYSRVILISMGGMLPFAMGLAVAPTPAIGLACLAIATFFAAFQGGIAGGVIQLMTPNQMRGQAVALYFLVANLVGMGFGPTIIAALTDYVFQDDAALNKSLALGATILVPLGALVLMSGLGRVREAIAQAKDWD